MKKSIMLSTTIMLIILFVALTTTTFAWYQAQAGEISISAESTASVTTTGPDSPYLVISDNSAFTKTISDVPNTQVSQANYTNFLAITPAQLTGNLLVHMAYPDYTNSKINGAFISPVTGETITSSVKKFDFYVKNIGDMPLTADLTALVSGSAIPSGYCYMLKIGDSYYHNAFINVDGTEIGATNTGVRFEANTQYTVSFYLWINNAYTTSNSMPSTSIGTNLTVVFSNVQITS